MTTLFRSRREAEELAARVDAPSLVRGVPEQADARLERLVGVAASLRSAASSEELVALTTPRADFSADLRERLMAEAAIVLTPTPTALALPTRQHVRRERRLVAAATAAVLLGGTAGVAAAAQSALPGEALYPIKRALEQADVALSSDPAAKGSDLLDHAGARLGEVSGLLAEDSPTSAPRIDRTLADFDAEARQGADLLLASYAQDGDERSVAIVRGFTAESLASLERLAAVAPESTQDQLRDAALGLRWIDRRAADLCAACSDLPPLDVPALFLASADVQAAMARVDASRLDNSHPVEVSKADLRKAAAAAATRDAREADLSDVTGSVTSVAPRSGSTSPTTAPAPAPAGTTLPSSPAKVLPKLDVEVKADGLGVDTSTTKVVEDLTDDTRTLLPDTGKTTGKTIGRTTGKTTDKTTDKTTGGATGGLTDTVTGGVEDLLP